MKMTRGQTTRARIAATALALLREQGSAGLTMRQVALRSGLSLSNVQYHFKSRRRLLEGITEHHLTLCHGAMEAGLAARGGEPSLRTVLQTSLCDEAVLQAASAFRELFALARTEASVHTLLTDYYASGLKQLTALLAEIAPAQPDARVLEVATILVTSLEGMYLLDDATPVTRARHAERLEEMTLMMLDCPSDAPDL